MRVTACNLLIFILTLKFKSINGVIILVPPGNGQDFVYSPVNVNATLHCEVNYTRVKWIVGRYLYEDMDHRNLLNSRGIFQYDHNRTSSSGVTVSNLIVFGDDAENNNTIICCQVFVGATMEENCTTLIIYDRPSPPQQVSIKPTRLSNRFNISWTANSMAGVDQNYTIFFSSNHTNSTETYYVVNLEHLITECGVFLAYVRAVNGAGESDPSNNVTIPSLPDIEPVTASLTHQVWKSNGQIMVNVSFKPAGYCEEYPIMRYMLTVGVQHTLKYSLAANETKVVLDDLEGDRKYLYSVIATNEIGSSNSSREKMLVTIDVQMVQATVRNSVIELVCEFIYGSDALGCMIVLVSNCSKVSDEHINLTRNSTSAKVTRQLHFPLNISCFHRVFAYDIDLNGTVSNFSIEGRVQSTVDDTHAGDTQNQVVAILVPTASVLLILVVIVTTTLIIWRKTKRAKLNKSTECKTVLPTKVTPHKDKDKVSPSITTTPDSEAQVENPKSTIDQEPCPTYAMVTSAMKENDAYNVGQGVSVIQSETIPIYALPEQLKQKKSTDQTVLSVPTEKEEDSYNALNSTNDHVYHVLESEKDTKKEEATPHKYESPKILRIDMSSIAPPPAPGPVYQDISEIPAKTKGDTESGTPHKHRSDPDGKETEAILKDAAKNEDFVDASQLSAGTSSVSTK